MIRAVAGSKLASAACLLARSVVVDLNGRVGFRGASCDVTESRLKAHRNDDRLSGGSTEKSGDNYKRQKIAEQKDGTVNHASEHRAR